MEFVAPKSASEILRNTANDFESGVLKWGKKAFHKLIDGEICNCSHGGIRYEGNEETHSLLVKKNVEAPIAVVLVLARAGADYEFYSRHYTDNFNGKHLHLYRAHYFAHKVGLTFEFNDAPETTLADCILKLREAANMAEKEGF